MAHARFLHTADLHLSRPFGFLPPEVAEERRREQRRTLARIADIAVDRGVDLVIIAGDLFDRSHPDPSDVEAVTATFTRLRDHGKQVFIIPGNHDHCSPYSIWQNFNVDGVSIFREPEYSCKIIEELGIAIAGTAFDRSDSGRRAFENIEIACDLPCILLSHASYEAFEGQIERYHPFSEKELASVPAVYVALGHYHRLNMFRSGSVTACYPGSPEGLAFDMAETGDRYVILGEVTDDGEVKIEQVKVNCRPIYCGEIDCTSLESDDSLHAAFRNFCKQDAIVQVQLKGTPPRELMHTIDELADRFRESCHYLSVDTSGVLIPIGQAPNERTILGMFRKHMLDQIAHEQDPDRQRLLRRALDLGLAAFEKE